MTSIYRLASEFQCRPQVTERAAPRVLRRVPFSGEGSAAPEVLAEREWLITNGLGGYASGTLLGAITRRYHGLLIAALPAPLGRVMMLNQLTEYLELPDRRQIELSSGLGFNESSESPGFASLAEFRLEDGVPVWRYQIGGIVIEKKIFMVHGRNTTLISYDLLEGDERVRVKLCPHVQFRPHENFVDKALEDYTLKATRGGFEICTAAAHPPLRLLVHGRDWSFSGGHAKIDKVFFRAEQQRGYEAFGELCSFGWFEAEVCRNEPMTLIASTEPWESITEMTPQENYAEEFSRRQRLASRAGIEDGTSIKAELVLAADQFVIAPVDPNKEKDAVGAHTIIAGYHWFTDWGRDTMISLEGLTLLTGRQREARGILDVFSEHIRDGLIPNFFPEGEQEGVYHTADATLWFFHALQRYLAMTGDREFLRQLLPKLSDIVAKHLQGTRFGIGVDPNDGLLRQGQEGYQLTWMDAKVEDWVVTPRRGKAVEINALWYNALRLLEGWLREEGDGERARTRLPRTRKKPGILSTAAIGMKKVVISTTLSIVTTKVEKTIPHAGPIKSWPFRWTIRSSIASAGVHCSMSCVEASLTPYGLRSLAPDHPNYQARYFGDLRARDAAYHQGTVWAWLIGPFIDAWLKVYPDDRAGARGFLNAFADHLGEACIGTISEIFDAEPPFTPRGCISQAWSVAEVLRCAIKTGALIGR